MCTEAMCLLAKVMAPGRRGTWAVLPGARGMMGNGIVFNPRTAGGSLDDVKFYDGALRMSV